MLSPVSLAVGMPRSTISKALEKSMSTSMTNTRMGRPTGLLPAEGNHDYDLRLRPTIFPFLAPWTTVTSYTD